MAISVSTFSLLTSVKCICLHGHPQVGKVMQMRWRGMPAMVNSGEPSCQEKLLSITHIYPYRKPTKVNEERILR
jgi:hypothetical protein